jgi:solute carrier family 25 oxoglutarate transporter 11
MPTVDLPAMADKQKQLPASVTFAVAGAGGCAAWAIIHPVNTLGVRLNLHTESVSFPSFASQVIRKEGPLTLYKGIGAGLLRQSVYATARLGIYEIMRDEVQKYKTLDFPTRFGLACTAGGMAAALSCPCEVSLIRMSNDMALPPEQRRNYKSVADCFYRIATNEGIGAFWRGCSPFVNRAMLVGGTQVATYDQFKKIFSDLNIQGTANQACSAMTAGLIYSVITMPFESAKNRMAFQKADPVTGELPYTSTPQTLSKIAKAEGVFALWNGFTPYYMRCGGHTVLMFIAIEKLKDAYWAMAK